MPIDADVKAFLDALTASGLYPATGEPRDLRTRYGAAPVAAMDGIVYRYEGRERIGVALDEALA